MKLQNHVLLYNILTTDSLCLLMSFVNYLAYLGFSYTYLLKNCEKVLKYLFLINVSIIVIIIVIFMGKTDDDLSLSVCFKITTIFVRACKRANGFSCHMNNLSIIELLYL